jgi:soluble lytic murein transglycosylase-like protein
VNGLLLLIAAIASPQTPPNPGEQQRAAVNQQRDAVRKQAESAGTWLKPWGAAGVEPGPTFESVNAGCEPLAESVVSPMIEAASKEQAVDGKLIRAVMDEESALRPCAISSKGAEGLMQLMPATAEELQVADPFDPKQSIAGGAKYLKQLLDKNGGDVAKALAAYNAGPNADDLGSKIPETKAYVDAILSRMGIKHTDPPSIQTPKPIEN